MTSAMVTVEQARQLLSLLGVVRSQPPTDWSGTFPIPPALERFYGEVGPVDLSIEAYGNPFFLHSLAGLWPFQAGYRWNGMTGEPEAAWDDDWLVIGSQGGDPFILSRASGAVLYDQHGRGKWETEEMFPDLNTMAACLGQIGAVVAAAGKEFTDEECRIRPEWREAAAAGLQRLLGSRRAAESVLGTLGWG